MRLREAVNHRSGCTRDLPRARLAVAGGGERAVLAEGEAHVGRGARLARLTVAPGQGSGSGFGFWFGFGLGFGLR